MRKTKLFNGAENFNVNVSVL